MKASKVRDEISILDDYEVEVEIHYHGGPHGDHNMMLRGTIDYIEAREGKYIIVCDYEY